MTPLSGLKIYTLLQRGKRIDQAICTKIYTLPQGGKRTKPSLAKARLGYAKASAKP